MSERNTSLFTRISGRYDMMNHLLSLGSDFIWRAKAAKAALGARDVRHVLDVGTGTGDLAIGITKLAAGRGMDVAVEGIDLSGGMLGVAREKAKKSGASGVVFEVGDGLATKFGDASFDVATAAFTMRNFDDIEKFSAEMRRVLRPGGRLVILEISLPDGGPSRTLFNGYFALMRIAGSLVDKEAYAWLVDSMRAFDRGKLVEVLKANEFEVIAEDKLGMGVAFLLTCESRARP